MLAIINGHMGIVRMLMEAGADPRGQDHQDCNHDHRHCNYFAQLSAVEFVLDQANLSLARTVLNLPAMGGAPICGNCLDLTVSRLQACEEVRCDECGGSHICMDWEEESPSQACDCVPLSHPYREEDAMDACRAIAVCLVTYKVLSGEVLAVWANG